ncbi:aldehyde dehydrogenase family protein [Hoeflea sp. CAU 1731]
MKYIRTGDFNPEAVEIPLGSFINGELIQGAGDELDIFRPSDGKLAGTVRQANAADVERAVSGARQALEVSNWARLAPRARGEIMRNWAQLLDENAEYLSRLEALSSSRPIKECRDRDIPASADMIRYYGEWTDKMAGDTFASADAIFNTTIREPYGVVGAISPWNVPILLATVKFAPALAAGNAVVLKPSEMTPFSAIAFARLAVEAGLPAGLFNVLVGTGEVTGRPLVVHPDISFVAFTGSTKTGQRIMTDCALSGPKPVSLELGGKSPQIVFDDVSDLDRVANAITAGMTRNSGQLCFCGSRLVVQNGVADRLLEMVLSKLHSVMSGPTWSETTGLPPIISDLQRRRIAGILAKSDAAASNTLTGGNSFDMNGGKYFEPTIVMDVPTDDALFTEEVFGPVLAVQRFDDFDEGLRLADHPDYGLTASVHTSSIDRAMAAARRIEAGTVWINNFGRTADVSSPFGGFKRSGFGKEFGREGYEKYLKTKAIWFQGVETVQ